MSKNREDDARGQQRRKELQCAGLYVHAGDSLREHHAEEQEHKNSTDVYQHLHSSEKIGGEQNINSSDAEKGEQQTHGAVNQVF